MKVFRNIRHWEDASYNLVSSQLAKRLQSFCKHYRIFLIFIFIKLDLFLASGAINKIHVQFIPFSFMSSPEFNITLQFLHVDFRFIYLLIFISTVSFHRPLRNHRVSEEEMTRAGLHQFYILYQDEMPCQIAINWHFYSASFWNRWVGVSATVAFQGRPIATVKILTLCIDTFICIPWSKWAVSIMIL